MIGRLQTEQDKARLLDGLATAGADVGALSDTIGALDKREFLLRAPGEAATLFTSRWAMSYLRGPLTREQIRTLMAGRAGAASAPTSADAAPAPAPEPAQPAKAEAEAEATQPTQPAATPAATPTGAPAAAASPAPPASADTVP